MEACDLAVAGKDCKFGLPELMLGLFPMLALAIMEKGLPKRRVLELIYTGERISAERAREWDLINDVVEQDKVLEATIERAMKIGKLSGIAIKLGRKAFYKMVNMSLDSALEYGRSTLLSLLNTEDARESNRAVREGREPIWRGK